LYFILYTHSFAVDKSDQVCRVILSSIVITIERNASTFVCFMSKSIVQFGCIANLPMVLLHYQHKTDMCQVFGVVESYITFFDCFHLLSQYTY